IVLTALLVAAGNTTWAASKEGRIVQDATTVLNDFVDIPENAIPPSLLARAYGIAVIPSVIKAGFVLGGRYGKGLLSVRTSDGSWSHPSFVQIGGASLGWQIGASSTDIILVFKNRRGVERIIDGEVTLGADTAIAAGPVGRSASAATNLRLEAEIYSYSRSRRLFAGVALHGSVFAIDEDANANYYGGRISGERILRSSDRDELPANARRFVYTLEQYMPSRNTSDGPIPYLDEDDAAAYGQRGDNGMRDAGSGRAKAPADDDEPYYGPVYENTDGHGND